MSGDKICINSLPFCIQVGALRADFEMHSHDFSELVIILNGAAEHRINGNEYAIQAGDVYVIGGDATHGFHGVRNLELCNIMYYPDMLLTYGGGIRSLPGFQALFVLEPRCRNKYGFRHRLQLPPAKRRFACELIGAMHREYEKASAGCEAALQSYFMALVAFLSREYVLAPDNGDTNCMIRLANAVAYMESHFAEPISLTRLAESLSVSNRHFLRIFRQHYGTTPIEYILGLRLENAMELLKNGSLGIAQVADRCGFADSNYFSRQFRKRYGLSPSEYRRLEHNNQRSGMALPEQSASSVIFR